MPGAQELVLEYAPGLMASVEVPATGVETMTLSGIRRLIEEDFDEDMMPSEDWVFFVGNSQRISKKQEERKLARVYWNDSPASLRLSIRPKTGWKEASAAPVTALPAKREHTEMESQPEANPSSLEQGSSKRTRFITPSATPKPPEAAASAAAADIAATNDDEDREFPVPESGNDEERKAIDFEESSDTSNVFDEPQDSTDASDQEMDAVRTALQRSLASKSSRDDASAFTDYIKQVDAYLQRVDANLQRDYASDSTDIIDSEDDETPLRDDQPTETKRASNDSDIYDAESEDQTPVFSDASDIESPIPKPSSMGKATVTDILVEDSDDDIAIASNNNSNNRSDDDLNEDDDGVQEVNSPSNPHAEADAALEKSRQVLNGIKTMLEDPKNELFCSDARRVDFQGEIKALKENHRPQTIIGVLGNTGVGKSSLLNALLDEAAVLPTSGSRGCTAAVVELVYNSPLLDDSTDLDVPVYRGEVEFMALEDWRKELKVLVEECSTHEDRRILSRVPDSNSQSDAAAAWAKIDQVYGAGTMEKFRKEHRDYVYHTLSHHPGILRLLRSPADSDKEYNVITVEEGSVRPGSDKAKSLVRPFSDIRARDRRQLKRWATAFRSKINSYVYRKGNGREPQTWPLIRKVRLHGPWDVLRTGACLVDLPGVRDANAARAKVAQTYLQNCSNIWIVAPIKRAVDDGTAKELLGEQFKRRLLMDGQYGNVSFICTQTDDLEASETMRDHADVAQEVEGRWERMEELSKAIASLEKETHDREAEEEDLKAEFQDAIDMVKVAKRELKDFRDEMDESDDEADEEEHEKLVESLKKARADKKEITEKLLEWRKDNEALIDAAKDSTERLQKELKSLCAQVRNEYSKRCLQEDFREGLKDLYRNDDDGPSNAIEESQAALPDDFEMDVFCISSNDYLKLMGIKNQSDGQANTFSKSADTQIPMLRSYVHETTSRYCQFFAKNYVQSTNDLIDRVKLVASHSKDVSTSRSSFRMKQAFDREMQAFEVKLSKIAESFKQQLTSKVDATLMPSLTTGARNGTAAAGATVQSWGSTSRRSREHRSPQQNGLYWSTYQATVRRDGMYSSLSAGEVNFNQELYEPMEKAFSTDWQLTMDTNIRRLLSTVKTDVSKIMMELTRELAQELASAGMDSGRLGTLISAAKRGSDTNLEALFKTVEEHSVDAQRTLNRSMLPQIQERMKKSYTATVNVEGGCGKFARMKDAMYTTSHSQFQSMFDQTLSSMKRDVGVLIKELFLKVSKASTIVQKAFENVFSICWENQNSGSRAIMDPVMQQRVLECRNALLPELNQLMAIQNAASSLMSIEREDLELDVMQVETFEDGLRRREEEAKQNGNAFDLCDSDREVDVQPLRPIKADPGRPAAASAVESRVARTSTGQSIVDLCFSDSEDEDEWWSKIKPSGFSRSSPSLPRIKQDPYGRV